jgi:polar amino acid transport system substrate-binding protein
MIRKVSAGGFSSLLAAFAVFGGLGAVSTSVEAAELKAILERGYLVVGVKENLRPLSFRNAQGQLEGFEIDLAHHLATALFGNPDAVVLQPVANTERLPAVLEGKVDLTIAQVTATVSRSRIVSFSTPYYLDGAAFLVRRETIASLRDLRTQTIAVLEGSDTIAVVRSLFPEARLVGVASYAEAKAALATQQVNVFAADASVLIGLAQEDPRYQVLPNLISAEPLAIAMPRGIQYDDLRRRVNQAIEQWLQEGGLQQQVLHWGLPTDGVPSLTSTFPERRP